MLIHLLSISKSLIFQLINPPNNTRTLLIVHTIRDIISTGRDQQIGNDTLGRLLRY